MKDEKMFDQGLTRRSLLINAGKCAVGVAGITALASAVPGFASKAEAVGGSTETWPWPYVKLDPGKTAEIAYNEWYRVFCGGAVISSVFGQLREKVANRISHSRSMPLCFSKAARRDGGPSAVPTRGRTSLATSLSDLVSQDRIAKTVRRSDRK